ncbi:FUSC family protein [Chromobacterium sp. IIBBL 290-4]|uniref:FUSC family protein n=1 Tax=Chromobacterium sp. IIBBL 290-4 TaxID=2953890 RepID=UPI0020B6E813|nr:FUSC family protein [Chromobacterium sp. IIBBL 290-4]UTH74854.1 FUSC family protein [Chromobacterium sp. IIBBL 290-4]
MNRWQQPWRVLVVPYYLNRYARQAHVLRVVLAFLIGLALVLTTGLPHGGWMLVTILIVLGGVPHWGGVRRKALERMGGSLLGAAAGLIAIVLHGWSPWACYGWMLAVVGLSSWHAQGKGGYLALLTGITLVIVGGLGDEPIAEALWRSCNVLIGSLIGMAAAATLPLRAVDSWRFLLADNLREAALLYNRIARRLPVEGDAALDQFNARLIRMRGLLAAVTQEAALRHAELDQVQRAQRSIWTLLDRMDEVAADTPALAESRSPRRVIVRTLLRAAHALRFNQPQLLADPLPAADNPAKMRQPTHCHWLVAELSLTVEGLRGQLQEILPRLIAAPPPARSLVRKMMGLDRLTKGK